MHWKDGENITFFQVPWAPRCLTDVFVLFIEEGYVKMFLRGRPVTMYMPKDQVDSYNLEAKVELPTKRLKLEWVYPLFIKSDLKSSVDECFY